MDTPLQSPLQGEAARRPAGRRRRHRTMTFQYLGCGPEECWGASGSVRVSDALGSEGEPSRLRCSRIEDRGTRDGAWQIAALLFRFGMPTRIVVVLKSTGERRFVEFGRGLPFQCYLAAFMCFPEWLLYRVLGRRYCRVTVRRLFLVTAVQAGTRPVDGGRPTARPIPPEVQGKEGPSCSGSAGVGEGGFGWDPTSFANGDLEFSSDSNIKTCGASSRAVVDMRTYPNRARWERANSDR